MTTRDSIKTRIKNGETVIGTFCIIPSATMIDTLLYSGMDFCIIDTEHGPIDVGSISDLVLTANGAGVDPIVRVSRNDETLILKSLDAGALGVQIPQVNTKQEAEKVVKAVKYSPTGDRGLSPFTKAGGYFSNNGINHTDIQNEKTMSVIHIEGLAGLKNLDEILDVNDIDVIFLGPYDISQSLGIPGKVDDNLVSDAIKKAVDKTKSLGRAVGSYAKDIETAKWLKGLGVQYIAVKVDATIYMQACKNIIKEINK
tara:strand:- start:95 stop:862 length:768 start_codon:yes stop_codon:yes gene_type:complete